MSHPPYEPYPVSSSPSHPPSPYGDQRGVPSKTQAGWALGLALIPSLITWIVAVILATQVISRSWDGRDHGKRMAVAALWIVGAWVLIAVTVGVLFLVTAAERDEDGRVTDGGRALVTSLRAGDCLPAPEAGGDEQMTVPVVPCSEPHDAEVYASFDLDREWTTLEEVDQLSGAGCLERFSDYVGLPARRSSLEVLYFAPISQESFNQDSGVACLLIAPEPLTTSLAGSKR